MSNKTPVELYEALRALFRIAPRKWTKQYIHDSIFRMQGRIDAFVDRVQQIRAGRTVPSIDDVRLGGGRHLNLAVLFIDICGFSGWKNDSFEDQKNILFVFNVFMTEMMHVINDHGGEFEKNTGDGLMAYFKNTSASENDAPKVAVEAAMVMHCLNDNVISPYILKELGIAINFRVGIDYGRVTISRIGMQGTNSLVAVGTSANIACKIMKLIPNGGICFGNDVYSRLPENFKRNCKQFTEPSGFSIGTEPYKVWELNHKLARPES